MNLVGKLIKVEDGKRAVSNSTVIQRKLWEYYCSDIAEIQKGALIAFHASCMVPGFKDLCKTKHGVDSELTQFDGVIHKACELFTKAYEQKSWDQYALVCQSITNFAGAFPERQIRFKALIVPLIDVISNKTDSVRKNSAVLLATLSQNEENKKWSQEHHGTEVLLSV